MKGSTCCLSAQVCSFTLLLADVSLTIPLSLSPAAPVNMAGPSSSTLKELQEQLDKFCRLAAEELSKEKHCNDQKVVLYREQAKIAGAEIDRQTSGEVQHHGSVLCCQVPLASGSTGLISMHTPAIVSTASWKP